MENARAKRLKLELSMLILFLGSTFFEKLRSCAATSTIPTTKTPLKEQLLLWQLAQCQTMIATTISAAPLHLLTKWRTKPSFHISCTTTNKR
ncbi:hypothetical protein BDB00DRAFT_137596 [Zychaea mexicana]|uniref:uncharacterized protein n=1 Tax=Zychaea mexicana TaxID=64656 RepID=UPI0022FE0BDA|nr:uncharacterized protein BDB00DRAFT_137596 [Zychaea mexicana]KAI9496230.1 hypothetical protein BDB00DRAFT_137596 [Zychaea mexicana]